MFTKWQTRQNPNLNVPKYCYHWDLFIVSMFQVPWTAIRHTWYVTFSIWQKMGISFFFFLKKDSIILLSLIGSRFEICHTLMNNYHWGQGEEAERLTVSEAASLLLYPSVRTVPPSAFASTLRHLQLHHSGSHPLEDKDRAVFRFYIFYGGLIRSFNNHRDCSETKPWKFLN